MNLFRDVAGVVYAYEADGSQDHVILAGLIPITADEADLLRNPPPTADQQRAALSAACAASILAGFSSSALSEQHHYPANPTDQINLLGSVTASMLPGIGQDWTTPFWCADAVGTWAHRPHTAEQIQRVGQDAKAAVIAAQAHLAQQLEALSI